MKAAITEECFITPADHVGFRAKRLFGPSGEVVDESVARLEPGGGGPVTMHTHSHNHMFVVVSGQARIVTGDSEVVLGPNEAFLVDGRTPHSVWNNSEGETVMLGINLKQQ